MNLIVRYYAKHKSIEELYDYLKKNYRKLSLEELDIIIDRIWESDNKYIEYKYETAVLLKKIGYCDRISYIVYSVCNGGGIITDELVYFLYCFIDDFKNINSIDLESLKNRFLKILGNSKLSSYAISNYAKYIITDEVLSKDIKFIRDFIKNTANKMDLDTIFKFLEPGPMEMFIDDTIRGLLIEYASYKLTSISEIDSKNYNKSKHEESIFLIFEYYTGKFNNLEVKNKNIEDKYNKEKKNMLDFTIKEALTETLVKIINDNTYIIEPHFVTSIIDELIYRESYYELISIISKKIQINTHYGINNISDGDVDSIINAICETNNIEFIYNLAEKIWIGANEKQQKTMRKLIMKSHNPEYIIKFSLYVDKNIIPIYFKKIENFYNYAKQNENKVGKDIIEEILDPKLLTLNH